MKLMLLLFIIVSLLVLNWVAKILVIGLIGIIFGSRFFVKKIQRMVRVKCSENRIIQTKAIKAYSVLRAILMFLILSTILFLFSIQSSKSSIQKSFFDLKICGYILISIFLVAFFCSVVSFAIYNVIVSPLFDLGKNENMSYRVAINDYRARMNIVFTLIILIACMIGMMGYVTIFKSNVLLSNVLSWLTGPIFFGGVIYLIETEKMLENIYAKYVSNEYYDAEVVKIL